MLNTINTDEYNVIALCGGKKNGKDTAATLVLSLLAEQHIQAKRFAFADSLKIEVAQAFGVSVREIDANKDFWRPILQVWGTEFRRLYQKNDNYWVEKLVQKLYMFFDDSRKIAIVTDCRFPNEVEALRNTYKTLFIYISRNMDTTDVASTHASEHGVRMSDCDIAISNNGTIEDLLHNLRAVMNRFKII